jgi:DNA-binding winged helix-turn-helix (wHTH) protein
MRYAFGDCRLDITTRELTRSGQPVHLTPKAFELLKLLLEARPRVVPKAELMERLWPDAFVVEANLPVLVGDLRTALGEHGSVSSTIKTHHGVGYSFSSDVRELTPGAATTDDAGPRVVLRMGSRRVALGPGINSVGRDVDADVFVNDSSVSRHHARIMVDGFTVHVEDLDSKNGTFISDVRVMRSTAIAHGAVVKFGSIEAVLLVEQGEEPTTQTL